MLRQLALALVLTASSVSFAAPQVSKQIVKPAPIKILSRATISSIYLEGVTNDRYTTGSLSFAYIFDRSRADLIQATLVMNEGAPKLAHLASLMPQHLNMVASYKRDGKTLETARLNFRGLKASEVGTRVLTYQATIKTADGPGVMTAKVQQSRIDDRTIEDLYKTTGTTLEFVPAAK